MKQIAIAKAGTLTPSKGITSSGLEIEKDWSGGVMEVWKDSSGQVKYVATFGSVAGSQDKVGQKASFYNSQTGRSVGRDYWILVDALAVSCLATSQYADQSGSCYCYK